ncbi:MAG: membrane protein insertase YidC [Pseudomonadota bacterium]|jgi:YidC/Oxa1 family membrane protein insertase
MSNMRSFLLIALLVTSFFLWEAWQRDYGPNAPAPIAPEAVPATAGADVPTNAAPAADTAAASPDVPSAPLTATAVEPATSDTQAEASAAVDPITVETDVLRLKIDPRGGTLVDAELLAYPIAPQNKANVVRLFTDDAARFFVAQSGFVAAAGAAPDHTALFSATQSAFRLADDATSIDVPLTWIDGSGVRVTKTYRLARGSYAIDVLHRIDNGGSSPWSASEYRQLQRTSPLVDRKFSFTNPEQYAFTGVSWYSPEERFQKLQFEDFLEDPLNRTVTGGWVAQQQHYFFAAWIPPVTEAAQFSTAVVESPAGPRYLVRAMAPAITIAPGASTDTSARLYVGPKLQDQIEDVAEGLIYTVDYGMVTFLAAPLFWALEWLFKLTGNWGWAIILITVLIKLAFFKLTEAQYKSFAKMRKLQPRLQALKERYGDDRQKMNQAMMELYQKEKINPLGGCLPILVQIPVFIALYWVLLESVELRQAPFIGWIQNLSDKDPYFILPILNGIAMYATQKLTPTAGMDPMQARIMQMMPVVFSIMFAFFPAGLVLYWTINGALGLAQQYVITKRIEAGEKA